MGKSSRLPRDLRPIVAAHDYTDEAGALLFQTVRYDIPKKDFEQRRPTGTGRWVYNLWETRRVLFRLPEVRKGIANGETVYVCEGEKDALTAVFHELCGTTAPMGAMAPWYPDYTEQLKGASRVVVVQDADAPGAHHVRVVANALRNHLADVRVLLLPGTGKEVT